MHKILIFTDLHVRGIGQTVLGVDALERFTEALAHAVRNHPDATHIVLLGDIVHSGKVTEYQRVKNVLDGLIIPYTLMCGNHDNRDNLLEVFPDTATTPDGFLQTTLDVGDTRLITLDTLDGPPFRRYHHSGILCESRMEWLRDALKQTPKRALVFAHHPPMAVGFPGMDAIRLANGAELLHTLKTSGKVAHMFCGHIHRTISGVMSGTSFTIFKSPAYQMPFDLKGDSPAVSTPEPGAYGIVLLTFDSVIVHTEDFQLAEADVQPNEETIPE